MDAVDPELVWIAGATGATSVTRGDRIQSLWSGYGEIYRVRLDGRPAVVKSVKPPARAGASHLRKCRSYDVEVAWYRGYTSDGAGSPGYPGGQHQKDAARIPSLLAAMAAPERWLLVLEDLDAVGYPRRHRRGPTALELDRCLRWLATFHARFLGVPPRGLWEQGTYWHLATRQEELAAMDNEGLRRAAPILDARLRECRFQTLVHGDAKLANFCFGDDGVAAVDFQYVGGGCGMSDVAYFLSSCSDDDFDEAKPLAQYFAHLRALLPPEVDAAALEREWRALYPIAAADFYRFLAGWAEGAWRHDPHGQRIVREVLRAL